MPTPEGKVKAAVSRILDRHRPHVYRFMPVQGGFGSSSLDYLVCAYGRFVAIETKAPGKKPTKRQELVASLIGQAGGIVFIIDDVAPAATAPLEGFLDAARTHLTKT